MANLRLKKQMLDAVNNQIKANDPPCTKRIFIQLQEQGCTKNEAKEMIASVLLGEMYEILKEGRPFDEKKYEKELQELVEDEFIFDDVRKALEDASDTILQAKYNVYNAIFERKPTEAVRLFMEVWDDIRKFVKDNFYKQDAEGNVVKPELVEIDDETDFKYELYNWLQDMEMEFHNSRLYEERIQFCQEVMDLFAWKEDSADNYKSAIGEALNDLKRYNECDEWLEDWLKEEPDNISCINTYIQCASGRDDWEKAKQLTEKYIGASIEFNGENEILLYRALDVYEGLGETEKAKQYQEKIDEYLKWYEKNREFYKDDDAEPIYFSQPIVKEKKTYPNDPCPCGSGKKYKKCCGR